MSKKTVDNTWGMKTVDTLLRKIYPARLVFNRQERRYLRSQNITNGV